MKYIIGILGIGAVVAVLGVIMLALWGVGLYNTAQERRTVIEAKVSENESQFDNMWKQISQSAQVADANKEGLREILVGNSEARAGKSEQVVFNWIKEAAPNVDLSIYKQVMNIISGKRDFFTARQTELVEYCRVYNADLRKFPQGPVLKFLGFKEIQPQIITSTRSKDAISTGMDNDTEVFKK